MKKKNDYGIGSTHGESILEKLLSTVPKEKIKQTINSKIKKMGTIGCLIFFFFTTYAQTPINFTNEGIEFPELFNGNKPLKIGLQCVDAQGDYVTCNNCKPDKITSSDRIFICSNFIFDVKNHLLYFTYQDTSYVLKSDDITYRNILKLGFKKPLKRGNYEKDRD